MSPTRNLSDSETLFERAAGYVLSSRFEPSSGPGLACRPQPPDLFGQGLSHISVLDQRNDENLEYGASHILRVNRPEIAQLSGDDRQELVGRPPVSWLRTPLVVIGAAGK